MVRNVLLSLFTIFALVYVFFIDTFDAKYHMLFKLIPMILLLLVALLTRVRFVRHYKRIIIVALLFCAIGDYTLQWFLVGLTCFLIGHVFYIVAFRSTNERMTPKWMYMLLGLLGTSLAVFFASTLFANGETILVVAVLLYIAIILTMGAMSFRVGVPIAIIGATLFIVSDTILAFNRFITPLSLAHELIMLTYYGAQLCFVLSIAKYDEYRSKVVQ